MPLLLALHPVDWSIIAVYLAVVLGIGYLASRKQEDQESYFLGGRRMPLWAVTLSVLATSLSAATYIGAPQEAYAGNLTYLMLNVGGILGAIVVATLFLPPLYRAGTLTIYGHLGQRFGPGAEYAAGVAFLGGRLLASGARLFIAGLAFSYVLFNDLRLESVIIAICLFGAAGTAYTCLGGIRAVIWTDTLQIILVIGTAAVSVGVLLYAIDIPVGQIVHELREGGKLKLVDSGMRDGAFSWAAGYAVPAALAMTFFNAGAYGTDQDLVQRMMTTKSAWRASASVIGAQLVGIPVVLLFMAIGLLLSVYFGSEAFWPEATRGMALDDSRAIYPQFLVHHLPIGVSGLAMAGLFAAAMSSLDSAVNAMAGSAVSDLGWGRGQRAEGDGPHATRARSVTASRWIVVLMGGLLTAFATVMAVIQQAGTQTLLYFALSVMTFAYAGLLGVFAAALFTRRGNTASVIAALVVGAAVIVFCKWGLWLMTAAMAWAWWGDWPEALPGGVRWPGLAFAYWLPIASTLAFLVCILPAGRPANRETT